MSNTSWDRESFIPYMFNSKGDNLGQREIQIEFEIVRWGFITK